MTQTETRFEAGLRAAGLGDLEVRRFPAGTRTAVDAARAIGCDVGQIVKSLVFRSGDEAVVALISGSERLAPPRLEALTGSPVTQADAAFVRAATGYAIGGVPPFGHAQPVPVYMDRGLFRYEVVWAAAGRPDSVFAIAPERLKALSQAQLAVLVERP